MFNAPRFTSPVIRRMDDNRREQQMQSSRKRLKPSSTATEHQGSTLTAWPGPTRSARPRSFLSLPPELRNSIYAGCVECLYVNVSEVDWIGAFSGLVEAYPLIGKEWSDFWYTNNIFLLDARHAVLSWSIENVGVYPPPITA